MGDGRIIKVNRLIKRYNLPDIIGYTALMGVGGIWLLTGQSVSLIKDSSLLSVIAIYELTMKANDIVAETFLVFEIYFTIAAIYLILAIALSQVVAFFERRCKVMA